MTDNDRPLKRARLSDTEPCSSPPPPPTSHFKSQHPEFWLPDGNVILVAKDATAFRVYRGLTAAQSTVFEDMFVSSTSGADELFDGCPVVQLTDSSEDLTHLLRVLLPKSERRYYRTEPRTFNELSAVIRLAHKYHIQDVQDQALHVLQESVLSSRFSHWNGASALMDPWTLEFIGIINLARLTDTPCMLPGAFYVCAYLYSEILDGWTREDGTIEHLSAADLRRCLDGQCTLVLEDGLLLGRILAGEPVAGCTTPARCRLSCQSMLVRIVTSRQLNEHRRALDYWHAAITNMGALDEASGMKICCVCEKELLRRARRERWLLWKRLPFGVAVEGWGAGQDENGDGDGDGNA